MRFARLTGDLGSLSGPDIRLLALAHTLETTRHGEAHLRRVPPKPRVMKAPSRHGRLPGWGAAAAPGDWGETEAQAGAAGKAQGPPRVHFSRVRRNLNPTADLRPVPDSTGASTGAPGQGPRPAAARSSSASSDTGSGSPSGADPSGQEGMSDEGAKEGPGEGQPMDSFDGGDCSPAGVDAETAAGVEASGVQRHTGAPGAAAAAPAGAGPEPDSGARPETQAGVASGGDEGEEEEWDVAKTRSARRHKQRRMRRRAERAAALAAPAAAPADGALPGAPADGAGPRGPEDAAAGDAAWQALEEVESSVALVTADFPMQNVLLQMGLKLVTPDGVRVRRTARFVLRCSACRAVAKDTTRVFCPRCGIAALEKVEALVDAAGAEHYGVRKRHIIRGTRFSLPMPRGGKNNSDPILSEDMLRVRMPVIKRQEKQAGGDCVDPFAAEYGPDTWFKMHAPGAKGSGVRAVLASARHNPNEQRGGRAGRRKK